MKGGIKRGTSFLKCSQYVLKKTKTPEIVGGNLTGSTAHEMAAELRSIAAQRPDIQKPVWHGSLSAAPAERLSSEKWDDLAKDYMRGLGFDLGKTAYLVVRHNDRPHDHVHIEASRVMLDGTIYLGRNEHLKATRLTQELEKKYGLIRTKGPDEPQKVKRPTPGEAERYQRKGAVPPRVKLQKIIDTAIMDKPTQEIFEQRLTVAGVEFKRSSNGYSYCLDGVQFKGSQLGKGYSNASVQKAFITPEELKQVMAAQLAEINMEWAVIQAQIAAEKPEEPAAVKAKAPATTHPLSATNIDGALHSLSRLGEARTVEQQNRIAAQAMENTAGQLADATLTALIQTLAMAEARKSVKSPAQTKGRKL